MGCVMRWQTLASPAPECQPGLVGGVQYWVGSQPLGPSLELPCRTLGGAPALGLRVWLLCVGLQAPVVFLKRFDISEGLCIAT